VISTESRAGVTIVRLDRPERRNALVPELAQSLVDQLLAAGALGRPVVLTGRGATFCPGADLKWLAACADPALGVAELVAVHHLAIATLLELPVPVIAAINGPVAGGGLGLALAADYRIAAERSTFTAAYFRMALTPDGGSSAFLERTIGAARTLELLLTNRTLGAQEALRWGLVGEVVGSPGPVGDVVGGAAPVADVDGGAGPVGEVVENARLVDRAVEFALALGEVPGFSLVQTRHLLDTSNIHNQLQRESVAIRTAARGPLFRAALAAFRQAHPA
jgi:2-(1,2-epoxy-1,2-dihydrophenyl)acetyl-CoA isomerase